MNCAWDAFIHLLPERFRNETDRIGRNSLQEFRMRLGLPPELIMKGKSISLQSAVTNEDLNQCIQFATRYSPWSAGTVKRGFITGPGGHRIGIFGRYSIQDGQSRSLQVPSMLNLRVARDFEGIAPTMKPTDGSVLIIGPPGSGKTTLLRDLVRQYDKQGIGNISVIDEREEIFPRYRDELCFFPGKRTDVLSGCSKSVGIEWAIRNMTPSLIVTDEITASGDCESMLHAGWCGVRLFATAHAGNKQDLFSRPVYKPLLVHKLFQTLLIMQPDKSWCAERMTYDV